jgi:hypothetical protein
MTKPDAISQIRNAIGGGIVNEDILQRFPNAIIEAKIRDAANFYILNTYYETRKLEGISEFPANFLATYTLDILFDQTQDRRYAEIPVKIFSMPRNRGVRAVVPIQGDTMFIPVTREELALNKYYQASFGTEVQYFIEGKRVYFQNLDSIVDKVMAILVTPITELADDEELPIPAGSEKDLIDYCVNFFTQARGVPADNSNNNIDGL